MSNSLYKTPWPANRQQQVEYVRRLEHLVTDLEARKKPIVYRSKVPPVQADWENSWVEHTGLNLPIPPGTRLIWYDLAKSLMTTYTVAFDQLGGQQSSGTVVRCVDQTYDRPPMRLMAVFDSAQYMQEYSPTGQIMYSVHEPTGGTFQHKFPMNLYTLVQMGLHDLLIIYRLRINSPIAAGLDLVFNFNGDVDGKWDIPVNSQAGYIILSEVMGAANRTDGENTVPPKGMLMGAKAAYSDSVAGGYATGVVHVTHQTLAEHGNGGDLAQDKLMFAGTHFGSHIADGLTTAKFGFNVSGFYHYGQYPSRSFPPYIGNDGANVGMTGKAWLYGMFSGNTQEMVDGQYL